MDEKNKKRSPLFVDKGWKIVFWTTKEQMIGVKIKWLRLCWKTSMQSTYGFHSFTRYDFTPSRSVDSFVKLLLLSIL